MNIKGAIFDVDGTLLDSMPMWSGVAMNYLIESGYEPEEGLLDTIRVMSLSQMAGYFISHYKIQKTEREIVEAIDRKIEKFYFNDARLKSGVLELLERMKKNNIKMCVATATDRYMVEAALKRTGALDYFSAVFTCSEAGKGKDEPLIYELAAEHLGFEKSQIAVFEDAFYAAETAKKAGFKLVGVYDEFEKCNEAKIREMSDVYIKSMNELSEDAVF